MRTCPSSGQACYAEVCKTWPCDPSMMKALRAAQAKTLAPDEIEETEDGVIISGPAETEGRFEIEP